jgi:2-methylcitrate dehydratase PrpD
VVTKSSPTHILADFVSNLSYESIPSQVVASAKNCILDTLGCALNGSLGRGMTSLVQMFTKYDSGQGASIWGHPAKASAVIAALLNGTMAHTPELDDVHRESKTHAGAVVVPAALTLGETESISGKDLITAVVCGYETLLRIGVGIGAASHRMRGWHATGTCGTFGAAAAAGKILGLEQRQLGWALGLAGTQSAGLWAFTADGAENKKFHAGRAAESGILAALLAGAGMSGPGHILDASDGGLFAAMSDSFNMEAVTKELGERFLITEVSFKPFACCRSLHPAIDAVLLLRQRHTIEPSQIIKVSVGTYGVAVQQCGFTKNPKNVAEAQFSLAYGVAVALLDGNALLNQFSQERIKDKNVLDLANRVELSVDPEFDRLYPTRWGCRLQIEMASGEILCQEVTAAKGDPENPLSKQELTDKFLNLAQPSIGVDKSLKAVKMIENLEHLDNVFSLIQVLSNNY